MLRFDFLTGNYQDNPNVVNINFTFFGVNLYVLFRYHILNSIIRVT